MIIQALRKGLIEHEASDTGGVPRWKSSCPDRLAEATGLTIRLGRKSAQLCVCVGFDVREYVDDCLP